MILAIKVLLFVLAFEVFQLSWKRVMCLAATWSLFTIRSQWIMSIVSLLYPPKKRAFLKTQCPASRFGSRVGLWGFVSKSSLENKTPFLHFFQNHPFLGFGVTFQAFKGGSETDTSATSSSKFLPRRSVSSLSSAYGLTPYHCCLFTSQNMRSLEDVKIFVRSGRNFIRACCLIAWLWYGFSLRIQSGLWAAMGFPVTDPVSRRNWCLGIDMMDTSHTSCADDDDDDDHMIIIDIVTAIPININ